MIQKTDEPRLYAIRLIKDGPRVPCKAWYGQPTDPHTGELLDRSPRWQCTINGEPSETTLIIVGDVAYIKGERIDQAEYDYLLSVRQWALSEGVDAPETTPRQAIDHLKTSVLF